MIPETRWNISLRGIQGVGKTLMASMLAEEIKRREGYPIIVIQASRLKDKTTFPFYDENCHSYKRYKGITYPLIKRMRGSILVVEDAPYFMRTTYREQILKALVTVLSRANRIFTIITSQKPKALPTAMRVELDVKNNRYLYRVVEGRNATKWIDWSCDSSVPIEKLNSVFEGIYEGVEGRELGRTGKPVDKDSMRQRVFAMLDEGKPIGEIVDMFPDRAETIYVYHFYWKKKQRK